MYIYVCVCQIVITDTQSLFCDHREDNDDVTDVTEASVDVSRTNEHDPHILTYSEAAARVDTRHKGRGRMIVGVGGQWACDV